MQQLQSVPVVFRVILIALAGLVWAVRSGTIPALAGEDTWVAVPPEDEAVVLLEEVT
jgi:hypothetical protein